MSTTTPEENLLDFIGEAVFQIHTLQDFPAFLQWMQTHAPELFGSLPGFDRPMAEQEIKSLIHDMARSIWNATPLASNRYRPNPLPEPGRNERCYCGSGRKYKQCCQRLGTMPLPDADMMWQLLLPQLTAEEQEEAISMKAVPAAVLLGIANDLIEDDDPLGTEELLSAYFEQDLNKLNWQDADLALMLLCNAWDMLGKHDEKMDFLDHITHHAPAKISSSAWQRLATVYMDAGDHEAAWDAHRKAMKLNPKDLSVAILEMTLLLAEQKFDQIRNRATMILRQWQRSGIASDEQLAFMERCKHEPEVLFDEFFYSEDEDDHQFFDEKEEEDDDYPVIQDFIDDDALPYDPTQYVYDWVLAIKPHPISDYRIIPLTDNIDPDTPQATLFPPESTTDLAHVILPPKNIARLESRWNKILAKEKDRLSILPPELWPMLHQPDPWLNFLENHPEAANSVKILCDLSDFADDLARGTNLKLTTPIRILLGQHAVSLLPKKPPLPHLPAKLDQNYPLLHLMFNYTHALLDNDAQSEEARQLCEQLLELDPEDGICARHLLTESYIAHNADEKIVALCNRFPEDQRLFFRMGELLANYRLGNLEAAKSNWKESLQATPEIKRYLVESKIAPPRHETLRKDTSGKTLAMWVYRMKYRDAWLAERGALAWLKKNA